MKTLIKSFGGEDRDWELVEINIDDVHDTAVTDWEVEIQDRFSVKNKLPNMQLMTLMELVQKGNVLPPIIVDEDNTVLDGTHRLLVYRRLKKKKIKVLRSLGEGTGKFKGKFKGRFVMPYKNPRYRDCFTCGKKLDYVGWKGTCPGPLGAFPEGIPAGPLWFCDKCGQIFKENFVVWMSR